MIKNIKKITIATSLSLVATVPVLSVVSCSNSNTTTASVFKFETKVSNKSKSTSNIPTEVNVYDANYNQNAQDKLTQIKDNLSVANLQRDFNLVLTDFYEAYEQENKKYEIEIDRIKVLSKNPDGSFQLEVSYELEKNRKDSDEINLKKTIQWTPNIVLISKEEIAKIKATILNYSNGETQSGIDLSDIKEIFFGEKDEDDFEFEDKGIFDKIALLNKEYNSQAYLLGYKITLNDIFGKLNIPQSWTGVDINTEFLVPSLALNVNPTIFVPNKKPEFDYTLKTTLTQSEITSIFDVVLKGQESTKIENENEIVTFLSSILVNPPKAEQIKGSINLIVAKDSTTGEYKVFVNFLKAKQAPDMIVVVPQQAA